MVVAIVVVAVVVDLGEGGGERSAKDGGAGVHAVTVEAHRGKGRR